MLESGASEGGAHQITDFCIRSLTSASDCLHGANFAISVSLLGATQQLCSQRRWVWITVSPEAMVGRFWATVRLLYSCRHPCCLGAPHMVCVCHLSVVSCGLARWPSSWVLMLCDLLTRSLAHTDTLSAHDPAAGHHPPMPLLETPGHSLASLG